MANLWHYAVGIVLGSSACQISNPDYKNPLESTLVSGFNHAYNSLASVANSIDERTLMGALSGGLILAIGKGLYDAVKHGPRQPTQHLRG